MIHLMMVVFENILKKIVILLIKFIKQNLTTQLLVTIYKVSKIME